MYINFIKINIIDHEIIEIIKNYEINVILTNVLLDNNDLLKEYKFYAKEAFLNFYNFEYQFDPIFKKINNLLKKI